MLATCTLLKTRVVLSPIAGAGKVTQKRELPCRTSGFNRMVVEVINKDAHWYPGEMTVCT
jgi:hypothetical protein